jgi:hypothetical protein
VAIVGIGFWARSDAAGDRCGRAGDRDLRRDYSLEVARAMGAAETIAMDDHNGIIERVKDLTGGKFCERVIEAVGKQWPLDLAGELTGRARAAGDRGLSPGRAAAGEYVAVELARDRRGQRHERDPKHYLEGIRDAVAAVERGQIDPAMLVTHAFPLSGWARRWTPRATGRTVPEGGGDVPVTRGQAPRVGFLGVGWIGRSRLEAMIATEAITVAAIAEPAAEMAAGALALAPDAVAVPGLEALLEMDLDGVVIATPSALHAEQSIRALEAGTAVFCQKPLGRSGDEVARVVDAARAADRLLGLDLSYRHTAAMQAIAEVVRGGGSGRVHAVELLFHNAYGPDKPWFFDRALSGGGCVMDLGCISSTWRSWTLGFPTWSGSRRRCWRAASGWERGRNGSRTMRWRRSSWRAARWCGSLLVESARRARGDHLGGLLRAPGRGGVPQCRRLVLRLRGRALSRHPRGAAGEPARCRGVAARRRPGRGSWRASRRSIRGGALRRCRAGAGPHLRRVGVFSSPPLVSSEVETPLRAQSRSPRLRSGTRFS